jgi:hypothetical protein
MVYITIIAIFAEINRSMSKYNRTYHLPFSKGTTNDDKISDSISPLINSNIVITEKIDGENTALVNDGVYARSHATYTTSPWSREVRMIHDLKVRNQIEDDLYLFGENVEGIHSIEYTALKDYFYLFGVRLGKYWLSWDKVEEYSYLLDLELAPVLFKGVFSSEEELKSKVEELVRVPSSLGGEREGIVIRVKEQFHEKDFSTHVQKWVRENHVKTDEHWTRNWKKAKVNKYHKNI